jgi:NAD(P)-dependent dehydrogenase (short-subunit alcohol dehydrogenase family)
MSPSTAKNPEPLRVLITGANRGLGLEFARQYADRGARVFAAAREPDTAKELRALAEARRGRVDLIGLDVGIAESIDHAHHAIAAHVDGLDVLINNAGVYAARVTSGGQPAERLGELKFDDALHVLRVNAVAPLMIAQAFLDLLKRGRSPKLISITSGYGSVSGNTGFPYYYAASKAALNMAMRSFAGDGAASGIVTVVMNPGWVRTDMGTSAAPLAPDESVSGMIKVIDGLTSADNSRFLNWQGGEDRW